MPIDLTPCSIHDKTIPSEEAKILELNKVVVFQHLFKGLHILEIDIGLSWLITLNPNIFEDKNKYSIIPRRYRRPSSLKVHRMH
jgi:hypothetical protein